MSLQDGLLQQAVLEDMAGQAAAAAQQSLRSSLQAAQATQIQQSYSGQSFPPQQGVGISGIGMMSSQAGQNAVSGPPRSTYAESALGRDSAIAVWRRRQEEAADAGRAAAVLVSALIRSTLIAGQEGVAMPRAELMAADAVRKHLLAGIEAVARSAREEYLRYAEECRQHALHEARSVVDELAAGVMGD